MECASDSIESKPVTESTVPAAEYREKVAMLEHAMLNSGQTIELPVQHDFAHGLYSRTIFIPKGATAIGKIHKTEHMTIISQGSVIIATENGPMQVTAPALFVSPPGSKRAAYALEDTLWTTIHGTSETDLEKLESELIAPSYEAFGIYDAESVEVIEGPVEDIKCLG
jgi:quercetin dioxygenase-like cupin family protein